MQDTKSEIIALIKSLGYRVFVPSNPSPGLDTYAYYTDGKNIGYVQWPRMAEGISTVHIPNRDSGTGFKIADEITPETIKSGFKMAPYWASGRERMSVQKYKDWAAFEKARVKGNYCKLIEA